jgi:hypothetical protein
MLWGLAWYWWVLIVAGVAAVGYLKIRVFNSMMAKSKAKREAMDSEED